MTGNVNSIQSLGTLDGPGLRFVVFLQGCNLRCKCCHNPDTWAMESEKHFRSLLSHDESLEYVSLVKSLELKAR